MDAAERQLLLPAAAGAVRAAVPTDRLRVGNVFLLGIAFMFVCGAFQTTAMVQPLVLDSMRNESGGAFTGSGYTSLGIIYCSFAVCNWLTPPVVYLLGPKWSMVAGAIVFNFYVSIFLYLSTSTWLLYAASALVGAGAAVTWTSQGNFLTLNSSPTTMTRNTGIFWALLQGSTIFGNTFVYFEFRGLTTIDHHTRTILFSGLTAVCFVGILCLIGLRSFPAISQQLVVNERTPAKESMFVVFGKSFQLMKTKRMLLLCSSFLYVGLVLTFTGGVFGTSVGHSGEFGRRAKDLVGLCGILFGVGEMLGGLLFGLLGDRATRFGRSAAVVFGYAVHLTAFYMIFLSLAEDSPERESVRTGYVSASPAMLVSSSLLLGLGDGCVNSQLYSLLGVSYREDSSSAFAIFKFVQAVAAAAGFFYSEVLMLCWQLLILLVVGTACVLSFIVVEAGLPRESQVAAQVRVVLS